MDWFLDQARAYTDLWTKFATKMVSAGMGVDPTQPPPEAARQMRGATFSAVSQWAEEFMRSPEFLTMMKQSMDATLSFRQQMNEFFTNLHHSTQGVARSDIDSLLRSIRHLESRVLDRLEDVAARLDDLDRRLDALEGNGQNGAGSRKRSPRRVKEESAQSQE